MDVDCDGVAVSRADMLQFSPYGAHYLGISGINVLEVAAAKRQQLGHLDATKVPYFVMPDKFKSPHLKPNALGAIICDGKMFYAILGDTNGDGVITEVTGEASLFLAQTCFPNDGINGDSGHGEPDVAYIVFGDQVPDGVEDTTIDLDALKFLGDQQVRLLQEALSGAGPNASSVATPSPSTSSKHHAAPFESSSAGDDF